MKKKLSLWLTILSVILLSGTITTMVFYFINDSKVNSIEFVEIAVKSFTEAKELLDLTSTLGWMTIILAILTVLSIVGTVVMFVLRGREKKLALREVNVNEGYQQPGQC